MNKSFDSEWETPPHIGLAGLTLRLTQMSRPRKRALMVAIDAALCIAAVWLAYFLRLGSWRFLTEDVGKLMLGSLIFWYTGAVISGVYREVFRYAGLGTLVVLAQAIGIMLVPMILLYLVNVVPGVPRTLAFLQPIVFFLFLAFTRLVLGYLVLAVTKDNVIESERRRILIYGAGDAGQRLAAAIGHESGYDLVGYVDEDPRKQGSRLNNRKIYDPAKLSQLISTKRVTDIHIAIPNLSRTARRRIIESLADHPVHVMTLPNMREIIEGHVSINELREVEITDLLGRPPVAPDRGLLESAITGKVVMVTGAGGSIGSELCAQIARLDPSSLILVDAGEFALYTVHKSIEDGLAAKPAGRAGVTVIPELANVADAASIRRIMERHRPDTLFHAAAYKHVPLVEANVLGGTRNNVLGTLNTVRAACAVGVGRFILISTDKAVRPTNIMGATKRICEQILQAYASDTNVRCETVFAMVRFGNVLGSSGSVVPLFKQQIDAGGPITLTDRRITRFFMTIPEAAELVIQAGAMAKGGEVYVLDMGRPVKILDLARTMIRLSGLREKRPEDHDGDIEIVEIGLRPGEKLYEELLIGENPKPTSHERIMQAHERHLEFSQLMEALDELDILVNAGDRDGVRQMIAKLVPEYSATGK